MVEEPKASMAARRQSIDTGLAIVDHSLGSKGHFEASYSILSV